MALSVSSVYLIGVPATAIAFVAAVFMGNIKMDMKKSSPTEEPKTADDVESAAGTMPIKDSLKVPAEGATVEGQSMGENEREGEK